MKQSRRPVNNQRIKEDMNLHPEPTLDIPMITEDSEVIAKREGVHERIHTEIQHEDKEAEMAEEIMLEMK